ncbi:hypothetical protein NFI96_008604, partial [Prochilodus magdalenae]
NSRGHRSFNRNNGAAHFQTQNVRHGQLAPGSLFCQRRGPATIRVKI